MNKDRTPSAITQQPGRSPDPAETSGRAYAAHYEPRCQHQVLLPLQGVPKTAGKQEPQKQRTPLPSGVSTDLPPCHKELVPIAGSDPPAPMCHTPELIRAHRSPSEGTEDPAHPSGVKTSAASSASKLNCGLQRNVSVRPNHS
ncbi:hypothetical protein Anapl_16642 [Anas platyrhynchos]|uniref:Uncharacterized protein n=1 Tax=Anas platyrhynchos TaxID=8839 RepID=R0KZY1_ANAPL|nr:hypothetical protein Anapl_16642 [Anas platyrhynchos]